VTGPGSSDPLFGRITARVPFHVGAQLNHAAYEGVKAELQRTAATFGYLDATLARNELRVDPARRKASIELTLDTGTRYRFGSTTLEQKTVDETLVRRFLRYAQNDPFDVTQLLRTQFALDDSQYFAALEVLPGEPDRTAHTVPIMIRAEPNRRSRYSLGAGYGSDTGPRGTARWENRRVNHLGHRFNIELAASRIAQTLEARYIVPIGDPALEKLTFALSSDQRQLADLNTHTIAFEPSITRVADEWQRVWFLRAQHEITASPIERLDDYLLIPGISVARVPQGYLGEPLFNRGLVAELRGSHGLLGSDADFVQFHATAERALTVTPAWHLILRAEFGTSLVAHFSELPGTLRFFAGGDNSVRGFGFNELGPVAKYVDAEGELRRVRVGGKHLITGSVEIERDLPRRFGVAAFFDFGNAFDKFGTPPDPDDKDFLEYSVGIGLRLRLPVVTVGIDIAQPLSEGGAGPRLHINFSPKL
jgi:translocation and assembly module TamA